MLTCLAGVTSDIQRRSLSACAPSLLISFEQVQYDWQLPAMVLPLTLDDLPLRQSEAYLRSNDTKMARLYSIKTDRWSSRAVDRCHVKVNSSVNHCAARQ